MIKILEVTFLVFIIFAWFAEVVKLVFKHCEVEIGQNNIENKHELPNLTFINSDIRMFLPLTADKKKPVAKFAKIALNKHLLSTLKTNDFKVTCTKTKSGYVKMY